MIMKQEAKIVQAWTMLRLRCTARKNRKDTKEEETQNAKQPAHKEHPNVGLELAV